MGAIVLIVDDSALICKQVTLALTPSGFQVLQARDGLEALETLSVTPEIGLVICDVNMPRMDGLQFLEELRETKSALVPVVMLTTESQLDLLARAKALGAKGWIAKPFNADVILATATKLASI